MKRTFLLLLFFITATVFSFGQADTVVVPSVYNGDALGALNKFILGDTLSNGDRANPDRYYKLERNSIYFLNGEFHADFDLRLIADPADADNKPPVVASTTGSDGSPQLIQFQLTGNAYIKNIIFELTPPSGSGESNASFFLAGEDKDYYFDNCKWEWGLWMQIATVVPVNKIVVTNCYFRNPEHKTNIYNGRGIGFYLQNPADTVIMVNNSFFNMNSFAFVADNGSIPPLYFRFDHNTIVNEMKWPIHSYWISNAEVTNNLFYNAHSFGEDAIDVVGQGPEGLLYGLVNISPIPSNILSWYGITENERKYKVLNNAYYYSQDVLDYLSSYSLEVEPFMNSRTLGMFDNDSEYPNLDFSTLYNLDPNFVEIGTGTTSMITWMQKKRNVQNNTYWGWDPDGDKFSFQWPIAEDLAYTDETLLSGAQGGFPVGDLNWYPEKKTEWESWYPTEVKDITYAISKDLSIEAIYPNPADNDINLTLNVEKNTQLKVYLINLNGELIDVLFDSKISSGKHDLNFNISNLGISTGNYILECRSNNSMVSQKIQFLR
ncbi:MAG: T9SS type A sorting domain-containing protein [Saprospiraceae bacterium]